MPLAAAVPLLVVAALAVICTWVYRDAAAHTAAGTPVYVQLGTLRIDTPEAWAVGCAVFSVVVLPLYLAARNG